MRYFLPLLLQKKLYIEDRIKCNYKTETTKNKNYEEECFSWKNQSLSPFELPWEDGL